MKKVIDLQKIREVAGNYLLNGDFYCSEAVVKTIRDEFELNLPDGIIAMASGFPIGMGGSGCTCGAVTGGMMALGIFFGRTEARDTKIDKMLELSKELHDIFQTRHQALCCRVLTKDITFGSPEHMQQCAGFTGEVAEEVARIVVRELGLDIC